MDGFVLGLSQGETVELGACGLVCVFLFLWDFCCGEIVQ